MYPQTRTTRNRIIGLVAAVIIGTLIWTLLGIGVASLAKADDAVVPEVEVSTPAEIVAEEPAPVVVEEVPAPVVEPEAVVEDVPAVSAARVQDVPEHQPTTFCHKPGAKNQQELTTDDDGFLNGHLNHGDTLGACPKLFDGWVTWQAPHYVPVNPTLELIGLPQIYVGLGQLTPETCGVTYQQDHYVGTQAAVDAILADKSLGGTVQHPEDENVVTEWAFVSSEKCPEIVTYEPSCTSVTGTDTLVGTGNFSVAGNWDTVEQQVPFAGTLADIGTVLDIQASPLQYVGLHIHTAEGTIVFEEEGSYAGKLWSNETWDGVDAGMGYPAFGSIEEYIELNGDVAVTEVDLLYTSPVESTTHVTSFTIGCTTFTFVPPVTPVPVVFSEPAGAPSCDEDGTLPNLEQFMQETEEFNAENISIYFDREFDGPGDYTLTVEALNGYTFPDGTTVKTRTITVDAATGVTQSENPEGPCYLAVEPTPTPTPTETTPVPTPSVTTPVVAEVSNVATPTTGQLASTGTNGIQAALLTVLVLVLAGIAGLVISRIKRDRSHQI